MAKKSSGRTKVHSLGYMMEKLKRNIPNCEHRYTLTCAMFIQVGSAYRPASRLDPVVQAVDELILCGAGIEELIGEIEHARSRKLKVEMKTRYMVSRAIAEAKRVLQRQSRNTQSSFYQVIHSELEEELNRLGTNHFELKARQIGKDIRYAVRRDIQYEPEKKIYIVGPHEIDLTHPTIQILASEYEKIMTVIADYATR